MPPNNWSRFQPFHFYQWLYWDVITIHIFYPFKSIGFQCSPNAVQPLPGSIKHFHQPRRDLISILHHSRFLSPFPVATDLTLLLRYACSRCSVQTESHTVWSLVTASFTKPRVSLIQSCFSDHWIMFGGRNTYHNLLAVKTVRYCLGKWLLGQTELFRKVKIGPLSCYMIRTI